jgi:hypothetical protein
MMTGGRHGRNGNVHIGPFSGTSSFVWTMMQLFLKVFLVCLTLLVARPRIERLERRLIAQPWESGGVGLLTVVGFVPALVLATLLTCCLFLILYPVVFVVLFLVWLLGYTTVVSRIGRLAEGRFGWSFGGNPYFAALLGMVLIESLRIVGSFVGIGDGVFTIFGALLGGTGRVIVVVATIFGIGVVLLDRFSGGWRRTPPAPSFVEPDPPMPPAPPAPPAPPRETWESEPLP